VLFVAANFTHEKNRVQDEAGDDDEEKDNAENREDSAAPVQDDPADVECNGKNDESDAEDG
jgi:hypothetical protein